MQHPRAPVRGIFATERWTVVFSVVTLPTRRRNLGRKERQAMQCYHAIWQSSKKPEKEQRREGRDAPVSEEDDD